MANFMILLFLACILIPWNSDLAHCIWFLRKIPIAQSFIASWSSQYSCTNKTKQEWCCIEVTMLPKSLQWSAKCSNHIFKLSNDRTVSITGKKTGCHLPAAKGSSKNQLLPFVDCDGSVVLFNNLIHMKLSPAFKGFQSRSVSAHDLCLMTNDCLLDCLGSCHLPRGEWIKEQILLTRGGNLHQAASSSCVIINKTICHWTTNRTYITQSMHENTQCFFMDVRATSTIVSIILPCWVHAVDYI